MKQQKLLIQEDVSIEDIKKSQEGNLISKKVRQGSRMKLYQMLGYVLPTFDGGYNKETKGFFLELKVHISHSMFYLLENY